MICFQLCGDRDNPSVSVSDTAYCIPANPMSDRGQAVCIAIEGNMEDKCTNIRAQDHGHPRVMSFSWANSPSMDMPFSDTAQGLRASPNGYPAVVMATGVDLYNQSLTGDVSKALNAAATDSDHIPVICYVPNRYAEYKEEKPILRASGGDCGGGSEGIIVYDKTI